MDARLMLVPNIAPYKVPIDRVTQNILIIMLKNHVEKVIDIHNAKN